MIYAEQADRADSASGARSLEKGLQLFDAILRDRGRTPVAELAAFRDLPASTSYRLLQSLMKFGFVSRIGRGRYDVALRLSAAMEQVSSRDQLARSARPALRRLARTLNVTTHLGILENDMVSYLVKETGRSGDSAAPFTCENGQLEAYCSGIGKVLLAQLPQDDMARYLADSPLVPLTGQTIVDPDRLCIELARVARDGYAVDDGEIAEGLYCVAAPVSDAPGHVIAAISLSVARSKGAIIDRPALIKPLLVCAEAIGEILAQTPKQ